MPWYEYNQNNSGGAFTFNERVGYSVIIEADNVDLANSYAEDVGVYFDGVSSGMDCECCGDRWSEPWDDKGDPVPSHYGRPVNKPADNSFSSEPYWGGWIVVYPKSGGRWYYLADGSCYSDFAAMKKALEK